MLRPHSRRVESQLKVKSWPISLVVFNIDRRRPAVFSA